VQLRRSPYKTVQVPIACGRLYVCQQSVELPLAASIVGDKLLAMGPFSLGIPLGKGKQAQRLKHVFDVACLVRTEPDLDDIRDSFFACLEHENEIQGKTLTGDDVMRDTVAFCATTAAYAAKPSSDIIADPVLRENAEGLDPFAAHLFRAKYGWPELQQDMALAALCITAVCTPGVRAPRFGSILQGGRDTTTTPNAPANMALCTGIAAYYWEQTASLIGGNPLELMSERRE